MPEATATQKFVKSQFAALSHQHGGKIMRNAITAYYTLFPLEFVVCVVMTICLKVTLVLSLRHTLGQIVEAYWIQKRRSQ